MTGKDDFLSRWSRRKRSDAPEEGPETAPPPEAEPAVPDTRSDAEILDALGLEDPDTLGLGDDFKGYLQQAVPAHIRRRALRRLWRSNPVLAVRDGLNDYDFDESLGTVPKGGLKTAYRVGQGFANRAFSTEPHAEPEIMQVTESTQEFAEEVTVSGAESAELAPEPETVQEAAPDTPASPTRRRMVFRPKGTEET